MGEKDYVNRAKCDGSVKKFYNSKVIDGRICSKCWNKEQELKACENIGKASEIIGGKCKQYDYPLRRGLCDNCRSREDRKNRKNKEKYSKSSSSSVTKPDLVAAKGSLNSSSSNANKPD